MPDDRTRILQLAYEMLSRALDRPPEEFSVEVTTTREDVKFVFRSRAGEFQRPGGNGPEMTPLARAIMAVATRTPMNAKQLASKAGKSLNSHFYEALRFLIDQDPPLLLRTAKGFRLP